MKSQCTPESVLLWWIDLEQRLSALPSASWPAIRLRAEAARAELAARTRARVG